MKSIKLFSTSSFILFVITTFISAQNYLNGPESVAFDNDSSRYLVSSFYGNCIIEMDEQQNQKIFKDNITGPLGNTIYQGVLYVSCAGNKIIGINTHDRSISFNITINGAQQLDGLTHDNNSNIYVVGSVNRKIYKVNLDNGNYTEFVSTGLGLFPQDIIYDQFNNRLLLCSWRKNSPINAISLTDSSVSMAVFTTTGYFDGITIDNLGNVYVASHQLPGKIIKYNNDFTSEPEIVSSGHNEPAGLDWNSTYNILAVPNFAGNTIDFLNAIPTGIVEHDVLFKDYSLSQNYPNPFNPSTKIKFHVPSIVKGEMSNVKLIVYDILGNEITTLVNEAKTTGTYEVEFNASEFSSGIYFYQLKAGKYSITKKMLLMK